MMNNENENKGQGTRMAGRNPELTELVFVLDRSGSMTGMEHAVIDGFNRLLEKQRRAPGRALVSVELFDDRFEVLHDREELARVGELTSREYWVRGCTALLDAVGRAIRHIARKQREARPAERPGHTLFVINTDGLENASREYSRERIREMVREEEGKYGWEFLFLGANIDAVETAAHFGIMEDRAVTFHNDSQGQQLNYRVVSETMSCLRACAPVGREWKEEIEVDFKSRKVER